MIGLDSPFLQCLGYALFHSLWQLLILGWLCRTILRSISPFNPSARYRTAGLSLLLAPVLLIGTFLHLHRSRFEPDKTRQWSHGNRVLFAEPQSIPSLTSDAETELDAARLSNQIRQESAEKTQSSWAKRQQHASETLVSDYGRSLADPTASIVAVLWLIGICCFSLRPLAGLVALRRLRSAGTNILPTHLRENFVRLQKQMNLRRTVELRLADNVLVPTVIGYLRPLILVPLNSLTLLTKVELDAILLHELAHLRRRDDWAVLLQRTVGMLFFYHPSVHRLCNVIDQEREKSCDDLATERIASGEPLALALAKLTTGNSYDLGLRASDGDLLERITRLAGLDNRKASRRANHTWWLVPTTMALLFVTTSISARLTGQEASSPSNQAEITAKAQLMMSHTEDALRPILAELSAEEKSRVSEYMKSGQFPDGHPMKSYVGQLAALESVGVSRVYGVDLLTYDLRKPLVTQRGADDADTKVSFLGSEGIRFTQENPLFAEDAVGLLGLSSQQVLQIWSTHMQFLDTVDQVFELPMSEFETPESIEQQVNSILQAFEQRSASLNQTLSEEQSLMLASLRDYWAMQMDQNVLLNSKGGFLRDAIRDEDEKVKQEYSRLVEELKRKHFKLRVDAMFRLIHEFPETEQRNLHEYFGEKVPAEKLLELDSHAFFSAKAIDSLQEELEISPVQSEEISQLKKQHALQKERLTEKRSLQKAERLVEYYRQGPALVSRQVSEMREALSPDQVEAATRIFRQLQTARLGLYAHLKHPEFEAGTKVAGNQIEAVAPIARKMDAEIEEEIRELATTRLKTFAEEHLPADQVQRVDAVFAGSPPAQP